MSSFLIQKQFLPTISHPILDSQIKMHWIYMFFWILCFGSACSVVETTQTSHHDHTHEDEPIIYTIHSENFEVFAEHAPVIRGETTRFLIHVTWLEGHRPLQKANLTLSLKNDANQYQESTEQSIQDGIFVVNIHPSSAGTYHITLQIVIDDFREEIDMGMLDVLTESQASEHQHAEHQNTDGEEITVLKEQAWKMDFQTVPVVRQEIASNVELLGTWQYAPSQETKIVATSSGMITFTMDKPLVVGQEFEEGNSIASIHTTGFTQDNLGVQWQQKKAQWLKMSSEYERKKTLYQKGIVSKAQFEDVEQRYITAKSEYDILSQAAQNGFQQIQAPMNGRLFDIFVQNGDFVQQGDAILSLVEARPSLIEVEVPSKYIHIIPSILNLSYSVEQQWKTIDLSSAGIISQKIHPSKQTFLLSFLVPDENTAVQGSLIDVQIMHGQKKSGIVVPVSGLLEEYGSYQVVEQVSGESYVLRNVNIGQKSGDVVEIISGIDEGAWIVSRGAYLVKMISASGTIPEHGHAH